MKLSGFLSEFSLGEIFQLIEQGEKTGVLCIRELTPTKLSNDSSSSPKKYYLWFKQGHIIAATNRDDNKGLQTLIQKRGWLKEQTCQQLSHQINKPLGLFLKSRGLLSHNQLKLLFVTQVMRHVFTLFKLNRGYFLFEHNRQPPWVEMTGLTKFPTELTLIGLRMLKNWKPLEEKLPESASGLINVSDSQPSYSLTKEEWQIWEYATGKISLKTIAEQLQLSVDKVQKIAFRLIIINLAEELPMAEMVPAQSQLEATESELEETQTAVSNSFLNHLTSFLKDKTNQFSTGR